MFASIVINCSRHCAFFALQLYRHIVNHFYHIVNDFLINVYYFLYIILIALKHSIAIYHNIIFSISELFTLTKYTTTYIPTITATEAVRTI